IKSVSAHINTLSFDFASRSISQRMKVEALPVAFKTCRDVLVFYGYSSESKKEEDKIDFVREIVGSVFVNSRQSVYAFKNSTKHDILLILLVEPYLRCVTQSVYTYIQKAFLGPTDAANISQIGDNAIDKGGLDDMKKILSDMESIAPATLGDSNAKTL